ncbi:MAG: DnaJ domain-containing protein [Bacteroidales bacterium]|nr:DnaJ domain-containing protein [Bacteroidales bacterium]
MGLSEYYEILGCPFDASIDEIKRTYRRMARQYHPDVNHQPDAVDKFIRITEAYDFIIANHQKIACGDQEFDRIMEEWRKFRQERSRQRAQYYARSSYFRFRNSKYYKSTRILNASSIIFGFAISVLVLTYTIAGYIFRIKHPLNGIENPSVFTFILLLLFSLILFVVSFIYLKAYIDTNRKRKRK